MVPWIVLTVLMSPDSSSSASIARAVVPPTDQSQTFTHVRSGDARIRARITEGYARSATFRALVDAVESLSCLVYIAPVVKLTDGMRGALLHGSAGSLEMPVLRVLILANLSGEETIAVIGHELQHVSEAMRGTRMDGADSLTEVFAGLDPTDPGR